MIVYEKIKRFFFRRIFRTPYSTGESYWWIIKHIISYTHIILPVTIPFLILLYFFRIIWILDLIFKGLIGLLIILICSDLILSLLKWIHKEESIGEEEIVNNCVLRYRNFSENDTTSREKVIIGFVGDIMPTGRVDIEPSEELMEFFNDTDLILGNMEGIYVPCKTEVPNITNGKRFTEKILIFLGKVASPEKWLLCVSNNNSGDYGLKYYSDMITLLRCKGFNVFGSVDEPNFFKTFKDKEAIDKNLTGFNINSVAGTMWSNYKKCVYASRFECTKYHRKENYFNILFPHWHFENELYMRWWRRRKSVNLLTYGVYKRKDKVIGKLYDVTYKKKDSIKSPTNKTWDLVFGHHSHVPQPIIYCMINAPDSKISSKIKCSICRANIKDRHAMYQSRLKMGVICKSCRERFTEDDIEMMVNLFFGFGGYFGQFDKSEFSIREVIVEFARGGKLRKIDFSRNKREDDAQSFNPWHRS